MNRFAVSLFLLSIAAAIGLSACTEVLTETPPTSVAVPSVAAPTPSSAVPRPTAAPQPAAQATSTLVVAASPKPGSLVCPPNTPAPNAQLAARVNGVGIPLDLYNRQVTQAQAAMVSQGLDVNSAAGKEQLKSLKQQVLDQLINDLVIIQQADKEGVKFSDNDVNARLAQMVSDAGSVDKLNTYLSSNQMTLGDLCTQLRTQMFGEAMLSRVTSTVQTNEEQVHVRHILVKTSQQAQSLLAQIRQGKDFATLAKQNSDDEASKSNGGDLGWIPKGMMEPQFEAVAFQLRPGQVSDVVQTQFGFHIIKVEERDNSRPLQPEFLQNKRQQVFLAWIQAVRDTMKIERLVQP